MDAFFSNFDKPIIQAVPSFQCTDLFDISLHVKRDDLIDDVVSGNKLFKLYHHLQAFRDHHKQTLLTFGGAYSNHLHATAFVGRKLGINTVGFIRAEPHELENLTPTLQDCKNWGMALEPIARSEYKLKQDSTVVEQLGQKYSAPYWVPEGGAGELGVKGAELILKNVDQSQFDTILLACGTGTTLAGVIRASEPHVQVIGVPVLKGAKWMVAEVQQYLEPQMNNWSLECDYHFSGYGKWNQTLLDFMQQVKAEIDLPLDPVYTAKAFYALADLAKHGKIQRGSRVLFIHTGGLQGARP